MMRDLIKNPVIRVLFLGVIVAGAILVTRGPSVRGRRPACCDLRWRPAAAASRFHAHMAARADRWRSSEGALEQHIRQEVLYREALARGYDRDGRVVRRAMQQKMEFLAASQALEEPPTEDEIEAFFSLRQERCRLPVELAFSQVYISTDVRGARTER